MDEEEGTAVTPFEESGFVDDTAAFKAARLEVAEILAQRCRERPDADNVLARIEAGIHACAHYGQGDAAAIEQAKAVAWQAFLDYSASHTSPRRTRPG